MQSTDIPVKFPIAFASSASGSFVRAIPVNSQIGITDGAASLHDGFPPLTAQPIASGGVPPDIRDMNGILAEISAWTRWQGASGPISYDADFSTAVGGYPKGAQLQSLVTAGRTFLSLIENNTVNPDVDATNWLVVGGSYQTGFTSGVGYERRPSGILEQWGYVYYPTSGNVEPLVTVPFLYNYADTNYNIQVSPYLLAPNIRRDTFQDVVQPSSVSQFYIQYQDLGNVGSPGIDGFSWRSIGVGA